MSKPKKYPYVVYYRDQTFQTIDMTKADYEVLKTSKQHNNVALLSIGFMETVEIRSVFERIEPPKSEVKEDIIAELPPNMSMAEEAYYYEEIARLRASERKRMEADLQ